MTQSLQELIASINEQIISTLETIHTKYHHLCRLQESITYSLDSKGQRKRPLLLFATYFIFNPEIRESLKTIALSLELMHTASLIHDDIIDRDNLRRGKTSVPYKYGIEHALLTGDFLLFYALNIVAGIQDSDKSYVPTIIERMTNTYCLMCLGQSMEEQLVGGLHNEPEIYFEIIQHKTAKFLSMICELAGILAGIHQQDLQMLIRFGECLGLAYQIRDDVKNFLIGKTHQDKNVASDQYRRLVTLPILLSYRLASPENRFLLEQHFLNSIFLEPEQLSKILYSSGGIHATLKFMAQYIDEARTILNKFIPRGNINMLCLLLNSIDIPIEK